MQVKSLSGYQGASLPSDTNGSEGTGKVLNVSRHVPQSTLRILFSHLGDLLFFDYYSSVARRDGTFECVLMYQELSEAQLACKLDGIELGDRCLEIRLITNVDRFDVKSKSLESATTSLTALASARTLLMKCDDQEAVLEQIQAGLNGVFRLIELERDLAAGLPSLSSRYFLVEFESLEGATTALNSPNQTTSHFVAAIEAHKLAQISTAGNASMNVNTTSSTTTSIEDVLIYGVPASKLLEPRQSAVNTAASLSTRTRSRSRSRSRDRHRRRDYDRYHRSHRSGRPYSRSRSRSKSEERRRVSRR